MESYEKLGEFPLGEFQKLIVQRIGWHDGWYLDIRRFRVPMVYEEDQRLLPTKAGIRFLLQYLPDLIKVLLDIQKLVDEEEKEGGPAE